MDAQSGSDDRWILSDKRPSDSLAGDKGKRYAFPHGKIMIHQPLGGAEGQATDIAIHAKEILRIKDNLNKILAHHSGKPLKKVVEDTERDYFMSPAEAKKYGIVDDVLTNMTNKK